MGGSVCFKDVKNYQALAKYYDELLQDVDSLDIWVQYIEKYIRGKNILELASGSGVMADYLKNKGYNVIASDISEEMKEAAKHNFDGEYLILDMRDYDLGKEFDLILCIVDSINYLESYDDLQRVFNTAYKHLNDGGALIFDMHHKERLFEFEEEYIEEGYVGNIPYQWTIESDIENQCLLEHFAFYENDGIVSENHIQHVFDYDKVIEVLENTGFSVNGYENFIENEKVLIVGVKK
ncbi:MAG: class I SAM-dependent methyltransferase [Firmicutes bacterium]|nr:class I SAM-dependent methyltransferase [Bacillota bacterium]